MKSDLKRILILYNYFHPAYKAGGPIQSIVNLVRAIHKQYDIYIIASNNDFGDSDILNTESDRWLRFEENKARVIYLSSKKANALHIIYLIKQINPSKIFVNGIYSFAFSIMPCLIFPSKSIMHVRGMLHPGALTQKAFKKKIFLYFIKLLNIHKYVIFCVTDEKEMEYVKVIFGENIRVKMAQNFPANFDLLPVAKKEIGVLRIISIALVSKMKNHELVLEALALVKNTISWHIYGPIKDQVYWEACKNKIAELPKNIEVLYRGEINPNFVYKTLGHFHMFILPSQSENFGHALYEAMIAGKPVITSHNTPWNFLDENNAGYNVDLNAGSIASAIDNAASLNQTDYIEKVNSVYKYAILAIDREVIIEQYVELFN